MIKKGRGIACMCYPIGFTSFANPSAVFIKLYADGSAVVFTGATDMGQGATTALAQIASDALGIPLENVTLVTGDTERTPMDLGSVASRVTYIVGNAIRRAAQEVHSLLLDVARGELGVPAEGLEVVQGYIRVKNFPEKSISIGEAARLSEVRNGKPVVGSGSYNPATTFLDPETGHGKPYEAYVYATQIAEVELDAETGRVTVTRLVAVHDCGTVVNPTMVEGQVEGGVSMGLGYALMEEMVLEDGQVVNADFGDYVIPTSRDMPTVEVAFVEEPEPTGPFGAKGIGEPSLLPTAPAIINAIYDAAGVRIRELPATPEKVLRALKGGDALREPPEIPQDIESID